MKKQLLLVMCVGLLTGCGGNKMLGTWTLTKKDTDCPIEYTFKQERQEIKGKQGKTKMVDVVEMYTTDRKKENYYKGTYSLVNKDADVYQLDYGNAFAMTQQIRLDGDRMVVNFGNARKTCTYSK